MVGRKREGGRNYVTGSDLSDVYKLSFMWRLLYCTTEAQRNYIYIHIHVCVCLYTCVYIKYIYISLFH